MEGCQRDREEEEEARQQEERKEYEEANTSKNTQRKVSICQIIISLITDKAYINSPPTQYG